MLKQDRVIKRRATEGQVAERKQALYEIIEEQRPMTVRQVFYRATVKGLVAKTEPGYQMVANALAEMRKAGELPYEWLVDHTRARRLPYVNDNLVDFFEDMKHQYRKNLWRDTDAYVEIWIEKDTLVGFVEPITTRNTISLMSTRGHPSLSFLNEAATYISEGPAARGMPVYIYHLGDFDPAGVKIGETVRGLQEMVPEAEIYFERLAVNPDQIAKWDLVTRPTKKTAAGAEKHGEISVELEAIDPDDLRELVQDAIERHLPPEQFAVMKVAEESEKTAMRGLVQMAIDLRKEDEEDE